MSRHFVAPSLDGWSVTLHRRPARREVVAWVLLVLPLIAGVTVIAVAAVPWPAPPAPTEATRLHLCASSSFEDPCREHAPALVRLPEREEILQRRLRVWLGRAYPRAFPPPAAPALGAYWRAPAPLPDDWGALDEADVALVQAILNDRTPGHYDWDRRVQSTEQAGLALRVPPDSGAPMPPPSGASAAALVERGLIALDSAGRPLVLVDPERWDPERTALREPDAAIEQVRAALLGRARADLARYELLLAQARQRAVAAPLARANATHAEAIAEYDAHRRDDLRLRGVATGVVLVVCAVATILCLVTLRRLIRPAQLSGTPHAMSLDGGVRALWEDITEVEVHPDHVAWQVTHPQRGPSRCVVGRLDLTAEEVDLLRALVRASARAAASGSADRAPLDALLARLRDDRVSAM